MLFRSPILVVVGVREDSIVFCQDTKEAGRDHWTWDPAKLTTLTREGFRGKLCYGGGGELANKAWASVVPRSHEGVRQAAIDAGWVDHAPPSRAKGVTWHPGGASKAEWPWKGDNSVTGDGKRYCYILQDGRYITGIMWREVWPKIVCYTDAEALEAPVEEFRKGVAQSG